MKLTRAERLLIAQIVNIKLDSATLKDHIQLEKIFNATKVSELKMPVPQDFVEKEEDKELFKKYDGIKIADIEDVEEKKIIQNAIKKSKEKEFEIFSNADSEEQLVEVDLSDEDIKVIEEFYNKDKRPFSREFHKVILDLHAKLFTKSEKK